MMCRDYRTKNKRISKEKHYNLVCLAPRGTDAGERLKQELWLVCKLVHTFIMIMAQYFVTINISCKMSFVSSLVDQISCTN